MTLNDVEVILSNEPFVPLRLDKTDGTKLDITFQHAVRVLDYGILIFKGVANNHSRVAKGFDVVEFDQIERIEPRRAGGGARRKKAS
jgi:hypothetical protein